MSKKQKSTGKLSKKEIEMFKSLLLEKRNELLGNVSYMEKDALREDRSDLSNMPIHMADVGTDNYEQEFTLGLIEGEQVVLREVDEALKRIEDGTYGICADCRKRIPAFAVGEVESIAMRAVELPPSTTSSSLGLVVPMPTLPEESTRIASHPLVLKTSGCSSLVPRKFVLGSVLGLPLRLQLSLVQVPSARQWLETSWRSTMFVMPSRFTS